MTERRLAVIKILVPSTLLGPKPTAATMEDWVKWALRSYTDHSYELHGVHANVTTHDDGTRQLLWLVENTMRPGSPVNTQGVQGRLISMMMDRATRGGFDGATARFEAYSEPLYGSVASWDSGAQANTPTREQRRGLQSRLLDDPQSANQEGVASLPTWAKWGLALGAAGIGIHLWRTKPWRTR